MESQSNLLEQDDNPVVAPMGNVPEPDPTPYDLADDVFGIKTLFVNVFL